MFFFYFLHTSRVFFKHVLVRAQQRCTSAISLAERVATHRSAASVNYQLTALVPVDRIWRVVSPVSKFLSVCTSVMVHVLY